MFSANFKKMLWYSIQREALVMGFVINSKLILYANNQSPRRRGIFKYVITPSSFTETRLSSFSFEHHKMNNVGDEYSFGEKYNFFFAQNRTNDYSVYSADSIEELCNQLVIKAADYDDMLLFLSTICSDVPVHKKEEGTIEPENKSGE